MTERDQWFIDRIGKRIYRNPVDCTCKDCQEINKNWLIIHDREHALYLSATESDYAADWFILNYRDELS